MKGLLLRLSGLDSDAAGAVRVISFFDALVTQHASLDRLAASTSQLAECAVGIEVPGSGIRVRVDAEGTPAHGLAAPSASRELAAGGRVWLERTSAALPLDEMVLERFALAAEVLLDHARARRPEFGDPALVELTVSDSAGEAERSRALHLLSVGPSAELRVLAVAGGPWPGREPNAAVGVLRAVLAVDVPQPLPGLAIGVGPLLPAIQAPRSWQAATTAVRFAAPGPAGVVDWASLGGLAVLADRVTKADIAKIDDVAALDRLAAEPGGADTMQVLAAVVTTDSVRKAAVAVHRHHSSVAARLARAETALGFPPLTPDGRFRLTMALALWRLRDTAR